MKTVTSISGGQSSAYIAANYPADFLVFALVCIEDRACTPKDSKLVQRVSDRIGREFIATAEDDTILHTMFDLEQYLGQRIDWVVGKTFDTLQKSGLPNQQWRYCTTKMKIKPMFDWWKNKFDDPIKMQIGFRFGEQKRATRMLEKCNENGFSSYGKKAWQKPVFPMIQDGIRRDDVVEFWKSRPVRFAAQNNCVGCFHRNPLTLRKMFDLHPEKMQWFANMEKQRNVTWKSELSYTKIKNHNLQHEIDFSEWDCDSGHCGL